MKQCSASHRHLEGVPVVHTLEQRSRLLVHDNPRQGYEDDEDEGFGEDRDEEQRLWRERKKTF